MDSTTPLERRAFHRSRVNKWVRGFFDSGDSFEGPLLDVSYRGLRLATPDAQDRAGACRLFVFLGDFADGPTIAIDGRVVRATQDEITVGIERVAPDCMRHFENLVVYNADDPDASAEQIAFRRIGQ
jgi:hypothetical protein